MKGLLLALVAAVAAPAQTLSILANLDADAGSLPYGNLAQGTDGNYYGTTLAGGPGSHGAIFQITPTGTVTTLYGFMGAADGGNPNGGLVLFTDGNFYGTTSSGGGLDFGTVFSISQTGVLTTLYSFTGNADGGTPSAPLLLAADGNFYGTTTKGGAHANGTIFQVTPGGGLTTLYSFTGGADGATPTGALVQAVNEDLYGSTWAGGASGMGTIFKIKLTGNFSTLHSFSGGVDGARPYNAPLALGANGNYYGTTSAGGGSACTSSYGCGTVFSMTPKGALTTLHNFTGGIDEGEPFAGLVQANDGNLYGTTSALNLNGAFGTIFKITPDGKFTNLFPFNVYDGGNPYAGVLQGTSGVFYGSNESGGTGAAGTVFSLDIGMAPLIKTVPHSAKVGSYVIILGNNFTGATKVSFNGVAAAFSVASPTEITTNVPNGAISGPLAVTTSSGGILPGAFLVSPLISSVLPNQGSVGTVVTINGETLTGATSVTFGAVSAKFKVNSYNKITTKVPAGAKTSRIFVSTPSGVAESPSVFTVN